MDRDTLTICDGLRIGGQDCGKRTAGASGMACYNSWYHMLYSKSNAMHVAEGKDYCQIVPRLPPVEPNNLMRLQEAEHDFKSLLLSLLDLHVLVITQHGKT